MVNNPYMDAKDAISGSLAECYVTIDGSRYNFMQLYKFESKIDKNSTEVPILGRSGKGHKSTGWKGTWSGTAHYNQSIVRRLLLKYKDTGIDTPFEIQITNEDPTSTVGRQTVVHKGCLTDGGILAKFDADSQTLDEEISGTFDDFELPETFNELSGMR